MFLKSSLEACWRDVLQPAQVVVGWGAALRSSSLGLEEENEQGLGASAGVSLVRAVSVRKKRLRISYEQVFKV